MLNYGDPRGKLKMFGYADVTAEEGEFKRAFDECYRYYMRISVDDMFYELRKKFSIDNRPEAKTLAGEKGTWFGLGGNVLGQWLQAYARFYAVTGDPAAKRKADDMVAAFKEIMEKDAEIGDGLFMYFFEKYLRGFVDCFVLCGNVDALNLADIFVERAMRSPVYLQAKKELGDNGTPPHPVEIEWYTISESLYRYADVCELAEGDKRRAEAVRAFAKGFEYPQFWDIFYKGENLFNYSPIAGQNTAYFHSYSHLNSLNSAAYAYQNTGNDYYLKVIRAFYAFMREKQELITGGYGPHMEWLMPATGLINSLVNFHDSFETQCCSYAVYRISEWLIAVTGESAYGNWPEKLLYNATLASIPMDEAGHVQYYSDLNVHSARKFLHDNTWTCCTGTRPLLMGELHRAIYFRAGADLYVNLFIPSTVQFEGIKVRLQSEYPRKDDVLLHVEEADGRKRKICFRRPEHAKKIELSVNGKKMPGSETDGWICLEAEFRAGDVLQYSIHSEPEWSRIECLGEGVVGLKCGAVTLATEADKDEIKAALDFERDASVQLEKIGDLEYKTKKGGIVFRPYMDYPKGKNYHVYQRYGRGY